MEFWQFASFFFSFFFGGGPTVVSCRHVPRLPKSLLSYHWWHTNRTSTSLTCQSDSNCVGQPPEHVLGEVPYGTHASATRSPVPPEATKKHPYISQLFQVKHYAWHLPMAQTLHRRWAIRTQFDDSISCYGKPVEQTSKIKGYAIFIGLLHLLPVATGRILDWVQKWIGAFISPFNRPMAILRLLLITG